MKRSRFSLVVVSFLLLTGQFALATQADDSTITITGQNPGATPLIKQLVLLASNASVIRSVEFTITPKPGSVTRPLSGTFAATYLIDRGYLDSETGQIFLPIYGLYAGYSNSVTLTYQFLDGSSKQDSTTILTDAFSDLCGYDAPIVLQPRSDASSLSYDYFMVKNSCSSFTPAIIDTDGAVRWVGAASVVSPSSVFFDNAFYVGVGNLLYRIELDGTVTPLRNYSDVKVVGFHHNVDRGKVGVLLEADTAAQSESTILEVDAAGAVLKIWALSDIISAAMSAGGDDPSQFVYTMGIDWFHNNSVTYNRADNSLLISSRENFVICLDYETGAIKWILGDSNKHWHEFPSLAQYALNPASDTLPPIGQHAVSISYDQDLLLLDNGFNSVVQMPPGLNRVYSSPRRYRIDPTANLATEVWNYEMDQSVNSPICGSVYEDAPNNYLVDYAFENGFGAETNYARVLGLNATGEKVFDYRYPTDYCAEVFNATPLHMESTRFPRIGPQALNLSTRAFVGTADKSLIEGFIVSGDSPKTVILRALGPSLDNSGVTSPMPDPSLVVFDSSGAQIGSNDNWEIDAAAATISAAQLAPGDSLEAATLLTLEPGAYTVVVAAKNNSSTGTALVETYDLSPGNGSILANLSARGFVGTKDDALIGGIIIGDVASSTVVVRALGPSLSAGEVIQPLSDPMLTIYDANGLLLASNDNWQDGEEAADIQLNGLAPPDPSESALLLHLPAGSYSAVVRGPRAFTGVGLVEVYDLH